MNIDKLVDEAIEKIKQLQEMLNNMLEARCIQCNKKLGNISGNYEIKCPRCGEMNTK